MLHDTLRERQVDPTTQATLKNVAYAVGGVRIRMQEGFLKSAEPKTPESPGDRNIRLGRMFGDIRSLFARALSTMEFERIGIPKTGDAYMEGVLDARRMQSPYQLARAICECAQAHGVLDRLIRGLESAQAHADHLNNVRGALEYARQKKGSQLNPAEHWDYVLGHCAERTVIELLRHLFEVASHRGAVTLLRQDTDAQRFLQSEGIRLSSASSHNVILSGPGLPAWEVDSVAMVRGENGDVTGMMLIDATTTEGNMREKIQRCVNPNGNFARLRQQLAPRGCHVSGITAITGYDRIGVIDHGKADRAQGRPIVSGMYSAFVPCGKRIDDFTRSTAKELGLTVQEHRTYDDRAKDRW